MWSRWRDHLYPRRSRKFCIDEKNFCVRVIIVFFFTVLANVHNAAPGRHYITIIDLLGFPRRSSGLQMAVAANDRRLLLFADWANSSPAASATLLPAVDAKGRFLVLPMKSVNTKRNAVNNTTSVVKGAVEIMDDGGREWASGKQSNFSLGRTGGSDLQTPPRMRNREKTTKTTR